MKSFKLLFILLSIAALSNAQVKSQPAKTSSKATDAPPTAMVKDTIPEEVKIYNRAMLFGDYLVAKNALFGLITKNPDRLDYIDSLARIYFALGAYPQSLLAAKIVLDKTPANLEMLELSAISQDALGNKKEALEAYEKLYPQTKNLNHAYQIAVLQFSLQRYGECNTTTEKILADGEAAKQKISINVDQNSSQQVPLTAAVHNLRGVMLKEMSQPDKAKTEFEAAVKEAPDFTLAKNNLEMMNKPEEPAKEEKKKK
ncbi:MAG: tetratricopeptide repeat protein [Bacteroidia bacterium]